MGSWNSQNPFLRPLIAPLPPPIRRTVFISFYQGDRAAVDAFVQRWTVQERVFIPKALGIAFGADLVNSDNTEYVMGRIRQGYLADSTITLVLIGTCTHSRRFVDWEIKTSLRQGQNYTPNGLLGILLPPLQRAHLPPRFEANWQNGEQNCYARYRYSPTNGQELRDWLEDAFAARTARAHLINNSSDMMRYNARCLACSVTHPA
jgi:hypothetical protein